MIDENEWHKGEQCIHEPITCQEGLCIRCEIARRHEQIMVDDIGEQGFMQHLETAAHTVEKRRRLLEWKLKMQDGTDE